MSLFRQRGSSEILLAADLKSDFRYPGTFVFSFGGNFLQEFGVPSKNSLRKPERTNSFLSSVFYEKENSSGFGDVIQFIE
ncbi:hypothetical protein A0128_17600 [Leptospira tipperaryensis]|uniref:Uncharacterized protein n=1 Tax=Leptospira tipperaryensis TaxID=2564040 RepID=A0A1D7V0Y5_9LEPT|nr:hypothetical protein A0128_17600 [Leptospira tipperaryensis]